MKCTHCNGFCIRKGFYKSIQRYQCKACKKYQQPIYVRARITTAQIKQIVVLNNEGMGISSIGRVVGIAKSSVVRKIKWIARAILKPSNNETAQEYEIDEMLTYISKNRPSNYVYIIYAINKHTKKVIDFIVGKRNKENIGRVVNTVKQLIPKRIFTDGLNIYPGVINSEIHNPLGNKINHIERHNLTLRTHIKRLSRKTICFSKSIEMLECCLKLYVYKKVKFFEEK